MSRKTWALATAILVIFFGSFVLFETAWWFWTSELVHRIVMGACGTFGVVWGSLYFFTKK